MTLTSREPQVLRQAARGLNCRESGAETFHSDQTIKSHRDLARRKLRARNITHAVAIALTTGLIHLDDAA